MIILLKCICLYFAISYGVSNIGKILIGLRTGKASISNFQMTAMTIGVVGFLCLHVFLGLLYLIKTKGAKIMSALIWLIPSMILYVLALVETHF